MIEQPGRGGGAAAPWYRKFTRPYGSFEKNDGGELVFVPGSFPRDMACGAPVRRLLPRAERKVGELRGIGRALRHPGALARAHIKREAVQSSKIEGATATLDDLDKHEAIGGTLNGASDGIRLREVANCAHALSLALEQVEAQGGRMDLGTVRRAHEALVGGAGGGDRAPGRFRSAQNYIVRREGGMRTVLYKPPPHGAVPRLLDDLAEYVRATPDEETSALVQCAAIHYQFEAIHPFLDGNGQVGRLMIPLALRLKNVLPLPLLCLSRYFEENREEYHLRLLRVSQASEWSEWIAFFLKAVIVQAGESIEATIRMMDLESRYDAMLARRRAGPNSRLLLPHLLANPYTTVPRASRDLGRSYPAAKKAVGDLVEAGILQRVKARYRGAVYHAQGIGEALGWQ